MGGPSLSAMTRAQKGFSSLTGAEQEAVSRVNIFVEACSEVVLEAITGWHPSGCVSCDVSINVVPGYLPLSAQSWSRDCSVGLVWVWWPISTAHDHLELELGHPVCVAKVLSTW